MTSTYVTDTMHDHYLTAGLFSYVVMLVEYHRNDSSCHLSTLFLSINCVEFSSNKLIVCVESNRGSVDVRDLSPIIISRVHHSENFRRINLCLFCPFTRLLITLFQLWGRLLGSVYDYSLMFYEGHMFSLRYIYVIRTINAI